VVVTSSRIPDAPLPGGRYLRIGVIGPEDGLTTAFVDAFASCGRELVPLSASAVQVVEPLDIALLTFRYPDLQSILPGLVRALRDTVVVACASSLTRDADGFFMDPVASGSVTALVDELLPESRIVGAFHQFGADHLALAAMGALESDVPVVGDDREACDAVEALIDELVGFESVYAGGLSAAVATEGLTVVLREAAQWMGRPVGFRLRRDGIKILD
jgi:predicted dinucleotide-binding enzyme